MQANLFPKWFTSILTAPEKLREAFTCQFACTSFSPDDADHDLIDLFGRANQEQVAELLSKQLKIKYFHRLKTNKERALKLLELSLAHLSQGTPLDTIKLNEMYRFSALSSENYRESVLKELVTYLLSLPMPSREARSLGCYAVSEIRESIDAYELELTVAITAVFQGTINAAENDAASLTPRQEQLLFKHLAIKGYNRAFSWGNFLMLWMDVSREGQNVSKKLIPQLHFNRLLTAESKNSSNEERLPAISFKDFISAQTIAMLFKHPQSILPPGIAEEKVRVIINNSFEAQQDIIYYIDYLQHVFSKEEFPIKEAVNLLNVLIDDKSSPHYHFLCTCLLFVICKKNLTLTKEEEGEVFRQIDQLMCNQVCAEWREEELPFFRINRLAQWGRLPISDCVQIVVKFYTAPRSHQNASTQFLSFEEHLDVIDKIENGLGLQISSGILSDFLYFRTAEFPLFAAIQRFIEMRLEIISKWSDSLSIPPDLYELWKEQGIKFVDAIQVNKGKSTPLERERWGTYALQMYNLAGCIQQAVYPVPMALISPLMPIGTDTDNLTLCDEGETLQGRLVPLLPYLPGGPGWICQWIAPGEANRWIFSVSILDSIHNPLHLCTFQVPLEIPQRAEIRRIFFMLAQASVDTLGKETLADKDVLYLRDNCLQAPATITPELLKKKASSSELFDAHLETSPLLDILWRQHEADLGDDAPHMKTVLYDFILSFRTQLKKSFYVTLHSSMIDSNILGNVSRHGHAAAHHFDYEKRAAELHPLTGCQPPIENLMPRFENSELGGSEEMPLTSVDHQTTWLQLTISHGGKNQSKRSYSHGCYRVKMVLRKHSQDEQLTLKLAPFIGNKQFGRLMKVQFDLLNYLFHQVLPTNGEASSGCIRGSTSSSAESNENRDVHTEPPRIQCSFNYLLRGIKALQADDTGQIDELFYEPAFSRLLDTIQNMFGHKRTFCAAPFAGLIKLYADPASSELLKKFIQAASQARKINLKALERGEISSQASDEHNAVTLRVYAELYQFIPTLLTLEERQNFLPFINELLYSRTMIAQSPQLVESLKSAFNSDTRTGTPYVTDSRRADSTVRQTAYWEPLITPSAPIQRVEYVVSFSTQEGATKSSRTVLDFTKILKSNGKCFTPFEKDVLSKLLITCDTLLPSHAARFKKWKTTGDFPKEIKDVLNKFKSPDCPHLTTLQDDEQTALAIEALRFTYEVNLQIERDLMTLG